jgi:3-methyl-2-oxobutanoate hydroxymethyltransferase
MNDTLNKKPITLTKLNNMKTQGEKIACITAYDASFARVVDNAGADIVLVGDSLGMVIQGKKTTIPVKIEDMIYHSRIVASALQYSFLITDMPFMSFYTPEIALENASKLMQDGDAQMIKLEGNKSQLNIIEKLSQSDIPICAHIGLRPQSINKIGGYKVYGKSDEEASLLLKEATMIEELGADMILIECVSSLTAKILNQEIKIPIIGIGAGPDVDGQILVLYDILGITSGVSPKFVKNYMKDNNSIDQAIRSYIKEVKNKEYPAPEHCF